MVPQNCSGLNFGLSSARKDGLYGNTLYGRKLSKSVLESNQTNNLLPFGRLVVDAMSAMTGNKKIAMVHQDQSIPEALACNQDLINYEPNCRGTDDLMSCADLLQVVFQDKR
jgi:hypothetical protein